MNRQRSGFGLYAAFMVIIVLAMFYITGKISAGSSPSQQKFETAKQTALEQLQSLMEETAERLGEEQAMLVGHIFAVIAKLTKELGFADGFRVVTNCGQLAGQTVHHLHFHVLSGQQLGSFN